MSPGGAAEEHVVVDDSLPGVRVLTLARPERRNALTPGMVDRIRASMIVAPDVRAVVVTGTVPGFCSGVDVAGAHERQAGRSNAGGMRLQESFAAMITAIVECPVPVIAAIDGPAVGAGLGIALACDIRVASTSAFFLVGAPNIGLSAGECGISFHLPRLVGLGRAAEVMLTNRRVGAVEAERIGLCTSVVGPGEVLDAALTVADSISSLAPFGVTMTKAVYRRNADATGLAAALDLENRTQILALGTEDAHEARSAFLEKRTPTFTGR